MTVVVNENLSEQEVNNLLEKLEPSPKLFDAKKYFNKVAIEIDPLKAQKEMRDE